jgi:hypothetical protein
MNRLVRVADGDIDNFERWLSTFEDDAEVGYPLYAMSAPLARWLREMYPGYWISVVEHWMEYYPPKADVQRDRPVVVTLPWWAKRFNALAKKVVVGRRGGGPLWADEAREIIKKVRMELEVEI